MKRDQIAPYRRHLNSCPHRAKGGELAPGDKRGVPLVAKAVDDYVADLGRRKLAAGTIRSNRKTFDHLSTYFGSRTLRSFDIPTLSAFCASRKVKPRTAQKEIEHLRAFCAWCVERKWLDENPAKKIKPPRVTDVATLPFTRSEIGKLLAACEEINARGLVEPR